MSRAMLKGCAMTDAERGTYVDGNHAVSCALGSAIVGKEGDLEKAHEIADRLEFQMDVRHYIKRCFPYVSRVVPCPVKRCKDLTGDFLEDESIVGRAEHLFEDHHWSRERIAAWVEKWELEAKQAEKPNG